MINRQLIDELRSILLCDFGIDFSFEEVTKFAESLINYFDLLAKIDTIQI